MTIPKFLLGKLLSKATVSIQQALHQTGSLFVADCLYWISDPKLIFFRPGEFLLVVTVGDVTIGSWSVEATPGTCKRIYTCFLSAYRSAGVGSKVSASESTMQN